LWERAALIRARPVAGDGPLGTRFLREVLTPFVYRREVDPAIPHALLEQLIRSRLELRVDTERDLKLGAGGIREAEFFVQALQLIWGGRERSIRAFGIFPALERLHGAGLLAEREVRLVTEAYTLLRSLEHRIQWQSGIQTHSLPKDEQTFGLLARTLEMRDAQVLRFELDRARSVIKEAFAGLAEGAAPRSSRHLALFTLMERINESVAAAPASISGGSAAASSRGAPLRPTALALEVENTNQLGVSAELVEHYAMLSRRPDGLLGSLTRERYPRFTEWLLDAVAQSPDPNQAALGLRLVFGRINHPWAYFAALAEDEHAVRRLVTALASSPFIIDTLASRPDSLDIVMSVGGKVENPKTVIAHELRAAAVPREGDQYEMLDAVVAALRRAKSRLFVEVVTADLSGAIELRHARQTLSDLADASLNQAARQVFDGVPQGLGIVALGKLGAQDLGYGSDLDVIFLYDPARAPDPTDAQAFFIRRAQQIIRLISSAHPAGPGYELDVRLRPSGSQGMLVTSLEAFALYHGAGGDTHGCTRPCVVSSGAAWERQTLLRARACAGDMDVSARAVQLAERVAYTKGPPDVQEMHRLRMRMERELAREREGRFDLKTGCGGLLDIEFATQWLQMVHGNDPIVHTTNTEDALVRLRGAGYLPDADYQVFREGYDFLRLLEQRLFIIHGRGTSAFDMNSANWPQLARRMRLQDPRAPAAELLRTRYEDVTQAIRASYLAVLNVA
jgi:glutamate-ammonia-ligase adenylyltransferase